MHDDEKSRFFPLHRTEKFTQFDLSLPNALFFLFTACLDAAAAFPPWADCRAGRTPSHARGPVVSAVVQGGSLSGFVGSSLCGYTQRPICLREGAGRRVGADGRPGMQPAAML
jgi:hypothetical protein